MIKAIIFDCFGVLTKDWWKEFLASLPPGPGVQTAKDLNHQYDAGLISLEDFAEGVHKATGKEMQPVEDIMRNPEPEKNRELLSYIKELKQTYKIGLLSNVGTNWVREYFLTAEEQAMFDAIILSYDVGVTKPNPEIYHISLDRLGVQPTEAIFIDDSEKYCLAAESVGMQSIHYQDFNQLKKDFEQKLQAAPADDQPFGQVT